MGAVETSMVATEAVGLTASVGFKGVLAGMLLMAMLASLLGREFSRERLVFALYGVLGFGFLVFPPWGSLLLLTLLLIAHARYLQSREQSQMLLASGVLVLLEIAALLCVWLLDSDGALLAAPLLALFIADVITQESKEQGPELVSVGEAGAVFSRQEMPPDRGMLRRLFYSLGQEKLAGCQLILLRLSGFEQLNHSLGNEFTELLLLQSITRMQIQLDDEAVMSLSSLGGTNDRLVRIGAYDFAFITCPEIQRQHVHQQLIGELITAINKPFTLEGCVVEIKPRVSYIEIGQRKDFDHLLSLLYLALDAEPELDVVPFHEQMEKDFSLRQQRIQELSRVDFNEEFELYFQPVVENETKKIAYLELLLRWRHPSEGLLNAERFINELESAGLGYRLATFVMEKAAELAMALRMEGVATPLSVNLFGFEVLQPEFVEFMAEISEEHKLKPGDIILESPLSVFLELDDQGFSIIKRLNHIGIEICLDGLGNTPIWLAKLPKLHFNYVKLDAELTSNLDFTSNARALLSGLIDMHKHLKAKVICQGIESPAQYSFIKEFNTYAAQGFLFSQPLSTMGMIAWLRQWHYKLENKLVPYAD